MSIELRHLRAFVAVAQQLSFTRAAEELMIPQPALTRTIKQLEAELQVALLERDTRHVNLTDVGSEFLIRAQAVLTAMDQAVASVRDKVSLRLGFSWLLPDPWAQRTLADYEAATGNTVSLLRCDDPLGALARGSIDVALIRGRIEEQSGLAFLHLFDEERVAICSIESPLAKADELAWGEVPTWPLVVNVVSGTTGPWSWPEGEGPDTIVETWNFDEWLESVAANRGIGVVPDVAMRRNLHPAFAFIPLVGAPTSPVWLASVPGVQTRLVRQFAEVALKAAAGQRRT